MCVQPMSQFSQIGATVSRMALQQRILNGSCIQNGSGSSDDTATCDGGGGGVDDERSAFTKILGDRDGREG